jgi:hypothetical protein
MPSLFAAPEVSATATDADGSGFTVITPETDAVNPLLSVAITV